MDLSYLTILVTGASKGIGKVLCDILNNYGATVIAVYNATKIDRLYDTYKCDISSEIEVKTLFQNVINKHEKIDAVINCAALTLDNDIYDKTKEEFMRVLEVNLVGTFLINKYASLNMSNGVIINMSSTDAQDTYSTISMDYASSKAGVENLTKNMAQRFPNLRFCALAPNWVDTETVLSMDKNYLESELKRVGQLKLIKKEDVALKIVEMIINGDDYASGEIIRMEGLHE